MCIGGRSPGLADTSTGVYNLYRDPLSSLSGLGFGACQQLDLPTETATDVDVPSAGVGFFYLVTAENRLAEEGTKGFRSNGIERGNAAHVHDGGGRTMNRTWVRLVATCGSIVLGGTGLSFAQAVPPPVINYQGVLRDAADDPQNGTFEMRFRFFDAAAAGNESCIDEHCAVGGPAVCVGETAGVTVTGGLFNVELGGGAVSDGAGALVYDSLPQGFQGLLGRLGPGRDLPGSVGGVSGPLAEGQGGFSGLCPERGSSGRQELG